LLSTGARFISEGYYVQEPQLKGARSSTLPQAPSGGFNE
jgi:hypothetical protein